MTIKFQIYIVLAIAAFYFFVAVFNVDVSQTVGVNIESEAPVANPVLELPPRQFFKEASPLVKGHVSGNQCASMWERSNDPGSADCRPLARKLAKRFETTSEHVTDPALWKRYSLEQTRANDMAIINYKF